MPAVALLDFGGENAVTLRAVGHDSDASYNAPYNHFKSRDGTSSMPFAFIDCRLQ